MKKQPSKNEKLLKEFSAYCRKNPEQRFFQSLRNWLGVPFVLTAKSMNWRGLGKRRDVLDYSELQDTFYFDEKDK